LQNTISERKNYKTIMLFQKAQLLVRLSKSIKREKNISLWLAWRSEAL
jgi:hypothetical protein